MKTLTKNISIKYEGENGFIDVNTFLTSQFHLVSIINNIQNEIAPEEKMSIKIKALKEGSFNAELLLSVALPSLLFGGGDYKEMLSYTVSLVSDVLSIVGFTKGEKPKSVKNVEGNNIEITGNNNNVIIVSEKAFDIIKNKPEISEAVNKNFDFLNSDETVTGISITDQDENKKIVEINRDKFEDYTHANPFIDNNKNLKEIENAVLYIKKVDYTPKEKSVVWNFLYEGNNLKATIKDSNFITSINNGERFGQGDSLKADITLEQEWSEQYNTHINNGKGFILKVKEILRREENPKLPMK